MSENEGGLLVAALGFLMSVAGWQFWRGVFKISFNPFRFFPRVSEGETSHTVKTSPPPARFPLMRAEQFDENENVLASTAFSHGVLSR
jgi:hypothetical protein